MQNAQKSFGALKTGKTEKSDIFWEIGIPNINVPLFENIQMKIALQVWCLGFTNIFDWFSNEVALGQNGIDSYGGKNLKKLVKYKVQIISHIKGILTHNLKSGLCHISMVSGHSLIGVSNFFYVQYPAKFYSNC